VKHGQDHETAARQAGPAAGHREPSGYVRGGGEHLQGTRSADQDLGDQNPWERLRNAWNDG
jgi:hypothetical protein